MPTRTYSNVTAAVMAGFRTQLAYHGTVVPPGDSGTVEVKNDPTDSTPEFVIPFVYDEANEKLTLTLAKKPPLMPAFFVWGELAKYLPATVTCSS